MSLILEALKKLEREKAAGERGFVVLSHLPWVGARSGRGRIAWAGLALLASLALALGGWALWRGRAPEVTRPAPAAAPGAAPASGPASAAPISASTDKATDRTPATRMAPAPAAPVDQEPGAAGPGPGIAVPPAPATESASVPPDTGAVSGEAAPSPDKDRRLLLNAISVRDGHPVAILNDRLVREGDSFDGVRILRIGEAEVEVEVDGQRRTLRF